jgi:hypothetical protein
MERLAAKFQCHQRYWCDPAYCLCRSGYGCERAGPSYRSIVIAAAKPVPCWIRNAACDAASGRGECRWSPELHHSTAISRGRARDLRMPTSANATGKRGKITPLMPQGKSARAAAARSRPSSLPAAAVKRTGRTTSAPSLRTSATDFLHIVIFGGEEVEPCDRNRYGRGGILLAESLHGLTKNDARPWRNHYLKYASDLRILQARGNPEW